MPARRWSRPDRFLFVLGVKRFGGELAQQLTKIDSGGTTRNWRTATKLLKLCG
jgi:hypothetical protein